MALSGICCPTTEGLAALDTATVVPAWATFTVAAVVELLVT